MNTQCPRCDCEEENSYHIFQQCLESLDKEILSNFEYSVVVSGLFGSIEINLHSSDKCHQVFKRGRATVHLDAAFDRQTFRSASGLIAWNGEGEILAS